MANGLINKHALRRLSGRLLARYVKLVHSTSSLASDPADIATHMAGDGPQILAMWHGQFLLVPVVAPLAGRKTKAMVARHGDGELIGEVLKAFDIEMIRGAGAGERRRDRGGAAALRGALRTLAHGQNVAMTADVPPGPARIPGNGIIMLAKLSGRPIRPIAVASSRYHAFDTWSRMTLNLPFSKIGLCVGDPISVPANADQHVMAETLARLQTDLERVTRRAYDLAGADPRRATPPQALPADTPPEPVGLRLKTYRLASRVLSPFARLILRQRERRGKEDPARLTERLGVPSAERPENVPLVWFHAASVGETNAALPVIHDIAAARPDAQILLTTGTRTSAELAQKRLPSRAIHQYIPVDLPAAMRRFLDHWRPDLCVLIESEIWPNLVLEAENRAIPVALINARLSPRSFERWRKSRRIARPLFSRLRLVLAQSRRLARQFTAIGARNVRAVGNLKVDAPPLPVDIAERDRLRAAIGGRPIFLAASTHGDEEAIVLEASKMLAATLPDLITIIAPRHPQRGAEIADLASDLGFSVAQRTRNEEISPQTNAYVADTIGELGLFYDLAKIAFIGGSLIPRGGQNPIEPVRLHCAVLTGPHYDNFPDSFEALLKADGAVCVRDAESLAQEVRRLLTNDMDLHRQLTRAEESLRDLSGAQAKTVASILAMLPSGDEGLKRAS